MIMNLIKRIAVGVIVGLTIHSGAWGQMSPSDAFNEGKNFGAAGKGAAAGVVTNSTGANAVPKYNSNAPESGHYNRGRGLLGTAGTNKVTACQSSVADNAYDQQECDAINFLSKNPTVRPVVPVSKTDPIIVGSDPTIKNPGTIPAGNSGQICRTVTQNHPGEYVTETCTTARQTEFSECDNTLGIDISWNYYCPAYTVEGPTIIPGTERVPPTGVGMIPADALCKVKQPVDNWTCPAGSSGPDIFNQCTVIITDSKGNETNNKIPAIREQGWNEYETYADKVPNVLDKWDNKCADKEARSDLDRKPWPECEQTKPRWCTQGADTRYFDGVPVYRPCWQWRKEFACLTDLTDYNCGPRAHGNCVLNGTHCVQYQIDGRCAITEESYSCEKTPPSTTTREVCEATSLCQSDGSGCFSRDRALDQDFGKAAALMEASREAGVYGVSGGALEIFKGYKEECSIKVLGGTVLKSCCGSSGGGGAFTNNKLIGAGLSVVGEAGREAAAIGSKYMYDALYGTVDGTLLGKGLGAMNSWASGIGDGVFNPTFSLYGFQFQFSFANGFQFVSFDPYTFAFQIGMMLIQEWLSCDQDEQVMSLKRGENLCVHIGTRCSKRLPIIRTCIEKKETHCCFNSLLAKIINRQGRAQVGMDMSDCGGFNEAQLQSLNFAAMDLSEFIQKIVPKEANLGAAVNRAGQSVSDRVQNYYDQD